MNSEILAFWAGVLGGQYLINKGIIGKEKAIEGFRLLLLINDIDEKELCEEMESESLEEIAEAFVEDYSKNWEKLERLMEESPEKAAEILHIAEETL